MKKIRLSTVSQVYEAFLHSRKALGAKEVTLRTYRTSFLAVCKYADISELPMEELSHEVISKTVFKCVSIGANRVYAKISDTWQILPKIFGDVVRKVGCFIHGTPHSHQCSTYSKLPSSLLCQETYRS